MNRNTYSKTEGGFYMLKKSMIIFLFITTLITGVHATPVAGNVHVTKILTYAYYQGVTPSSPDAPADAVFYTLHFSGQRLQFWLKADDPNFKQLYATLLLAYTMKLKVDVYYDSDVWPGSSSTYLRVYAIALREQ
jgi:hypothetical protein